MTFSVVVPTLNQGSFLEACLGSILTQNIEDLELIVVDGGSTDQSIDVLNRFAPDISHLVIEPDDGQADALIKGFDLATGDIQCYLNSDDAFLPGVLKRVQTYFADHLGIDAVYSDRIFVDEFNQLLKCWRLPFHVDYLMARWDYIPQECCFWRKDLYQRTSGIDRTLQFAMDYDLFIQFMRQGNIKHVNEFFAIFRQHPESKTVKLNESQGQHELQLLKDRYGIRHYPFDRIVGGLLRRWVESRSERYVARNQSELIASIQSIGSGP